MKHSAAPMKGEVAEALAVLIASTRSKKRKLSLIDIANHLAIAVRALGSYRRVAERIGLSTKMLRQFSYTRRLAPKVSALVKKRVIDSVDAVTHLAMLAPKDQEAVAKALVKNGVDTADIRAIVQWREAKPTAAIAQLIEGVTASKTRQHYVMEFVVRGSLRRSTILARIREYVTPANIVRLDVDGPLGRLVVNREGKREVFQAAKALGVPTKHAMTAILYDSGAA